MGNFKWLGAIVAGLVFAVFLAGLAARFGDGPTAVFPGGPLEAGELHQGPEPDWSFARDIAEIEFQLLEPPVSRTIWIQVVDGKLYAVSAYMNTTFGKLWKKWPLQAERDPRALIRVQGKRYERSAVRLDADHPAIEGIAAEVQRKYGAPLSVEAAVDGDTWFYALEPRVAALE